MYVKDANQYWIHLFYFYFIVNIFNQLTLYSVSSQSFLGFLFFFQLLLVPSSRLNFYSTIPIYMLFELVGIRYYYFFISIFFYFLFVFSINQLERPYPESEIFYSLFATNSARLTWIWITVQISCFHLFVFRCVGVCFQDFLLYRSFLCLPCWRWFTVSTEPRSSLLITLESVLYSYMFCLFLHGGNNFLFVHTHTHKHVLFSQKKKTSV